MTGFSLKPLRKRDTTAIILSFRSDWESAFCAGEISVVFRKTAMVKATPSTMYVYLSRPASRIVGESQIKSCKLLSLANCLDLVNGSGHTQKEISDYASGRSMLYVYELGKFHKAANPISLAELAIKYDYRATPSPVPLDKAGEDELRDLLGT